MCLQHKPFIINYFGGNNGKAIYDFYYKDVKFDCAKYMVSYIKSNVDEKFSMSALRKIYTGNYGIRIQDKFSDIIKDLKWVIKDENKINNESCV